MFALMAWHSFLLMLAEDRKQYFGPQGIVDVWLESGWDIGDNLEMKSCTLPNFMHKTAEDIFWHHRILTHHKPLTTLVCSV